MYSTGSNSEEKNLNTGPNRKIDFTGDNNQLSKGFTTGSAAAGAAKAAALMLLEQKSISTIEISTPENIKLELEIARGRFEKYQAEAAISKYAGDDPDVTDGMEIVARVELLSEEAGINIAAGEGIGKVTKPGLAIEEGKAAINPVPRKMIRQEVEKICSKAGYSPGGICQQKSGNTESNVTGLKITISAPEGDEIAQNTFNPRLGIEGGISILGTTGIVKPMSDKAYKNSLALNLSQARAQGQENIVLVFGNYGKDRALEQGFSADQIIKMSNYVGFMLEKCCQEEIKQVLIMGQIGKLVKVAAGIFNTHSQIADARLETLAAHAAALGADTQVVQSILAANTSEEAVDIIQANNLQEIFPVLGAKIRERIKDYIDCRLKLGVVLYSLHSGVLTAKGDTDLLTGREGL